MRSGTWWEFSYCNPIDISGRSFADRRDCHGLFDHLRSKSPLYSGFVKSNVNRMCLVLCLPPALQPMGCRSALERIGKELAKACRGVVKQSMVDIRSLWSDITYINCAPDPTLRVSASSEKGPTPKRINRWQTWFLAPCGSNGQPLVMVFETRRDSPRLLWFFFTHALGGQKTVDLGAVSLANVHTPNICFLPVLSAFCFQSQMVLQQVLFRYAKCITSWCHTLKTHPLSLEVKDALNKPTWRHRWPGVAWSQIAQTQQ